MDPYEINEMLDSDFDYDDTDKDPDYEVDSESDNIEENDDALSGVHLLDKDVNMNEIDTLSDISHISGSDMSVESPSNVQVPALTTSNQQINHQWKADDGNINAYTFNPNNEQIG
ncbi:uncharacterized protein LOC112681483 [Sipha flava]|uniref:Uncharacterized protein LOC112681483 n=1 Tax=Sipha flava TaxID=143950 RepID=A0A8B8FB04_9HEMI|nr:uncharacterized protein LOC112681483 [Sipha flava]